MKKKGDYLGDLSEYIRKNLKKGYTKESLKWALVNQGHSRMEVEKALKKTEDDLAREAPVLKTAPSITYDSEPVAELPVADKPFWKKWFGL
ncbi:hypothetical protein EXS73_00705 [Candidatus Pacearchaeota archaeon]|nr:hypothetical protein [Candidatus Pacearchaeota archaeon]